MFLRRALAAASLPVSMRDPANWPDLMREEWSSDQGAHAARLHRERCHAALRNIRQRLDAFQPDVVLVFGDDQYENFVEDVVPSFCVYLLDAIESRPFAADPYTGAMRPNVLGYRSDDVLHHRGHRAAGAWLARDLCTEGNPISYAYRLRYEKGLAHAFINTLMFLDVDRRGFDWPVLPVHVNCYGGDLVRTRGGRLAGRSDEVSDPPAPSAASCFDLGRQIARSMVRSEWRVALIASSSWSHAFLTDKHHGMYPIHESDRARLQELEAQQFDRWRSLDREQLEHAGQHELLNWVVLAGAMTEAGHRAKVIDYVETSVMNSNKCFAVFER